MPTRPIRRRLRCRRGTIMVHVLVATVIMAILSAGMVSIVLMQYRLASRVAQGSSQRKLDEAALARLISNWSVPDATDDHGACANLPAGTYGAAYTCDTSAPPCSCSSTDSNMPTIQVGADQVDGNNATKPNMYPVTIAAPDTMY